MSKVTAAVLTAAAALAAGAADNGVEIRTEAIGELRFEAAKDGAPARIVGYAAKFNVRSEPIYGAFREVIKPGAFKGGLVDVRFLVNHDPGRILGRMKAGTLRVREDSTGLAFEVDLPDTQLARDTEVSIKRGDLDAMSFGFRKTKDSWGEDENGFALRTLEEVKVSEISLATFPAYPMTEIAIRELPSIRDLAAWRASRSGHSTAHAERLLRLAEV